MGKARTRFANNWELAGGTCGFSCAGRKSGLTVPIVRPYQTRESTRRDRTLLRRRWLALRDASSNLLIISFTSCERLTAHGRNNMGRLWAGLAAFPATCWGR